VYVSIRSCVGQERRRLNPRENGVADGGRGKNNTTRVRSGRGIRVYTHTQDSKVVVYNSGSAKTVHMVYYNRDSGI